MERTLKISHLYDDPVMNIATDTLRIKKQAIVFVNTKRGAESQAEKISLKIKTNLPAHLEMADKALHALSKPTKQCIRLSTCLKKGIAFHHAGLSPKQRDIVEENFRKGNVSIICATPTLCLSSDTHLWHGMNETEVSKFKTSYPIFVLSQNRLFDMKAQKIQRISNSSKLIQITSVSGYSIKVTPNHKMLIKRKNKILLVNAGNILKDDKIATIGKLNIKHAKTPRIKDFILDNEFTGINLTFGKPLSYLIGAMLGDGYSGAETLKKVIKYKGSPSIVGVDNEIFVQVEKVCKTLNLTCRKTKIYNGTPCRVLGKNKWFREFLVRSGVEKREKKHVANKLILMNLSNVSWLLKGLFDTDGYVNKLSLIGFSNVSEKLVKQMQKLLLRFGIVSSIRKRKAGTMKIYEKEYKTMPSFELRIMQKKSIIDFYKNIGFNLSRKQNDLIELVAKLCSNLNYVKCSKCKYKIFRDIFSGRSKSHKMWAKQKIEVIKRLGEDKELGSREIERILGFLPRKKENRLNHHYQLIKKRKIGSRSNTEWFWSLNNIGRWIYDNILSQDLSIFEFFKLRKCPVCGTELDWIIKKGWRNSDFDGDVFWDKIKSIKEVKVENEVYDVVLPNKPKNDHLFVAEGFIVHNSMGVDLPAFRTILRDLKRYGPRGMAPIHVLEYEQMSGRAGRPGMEEYGEAIAVAKSESEKENIYEKYVSGLPEHINSKLAVEPVFRTYVLSLIAAEFVNDVESLTEFFSKTFYAHQFKDMGRIKSLIMKILGLLEEWEFIKYEKFKQDFQSADQIANEKVQATPLGRRVSELYLDPSDAHYMITQIRKATSEKSDKLVNEFSFLFMICRTLDIKPLLRVKVSEYDEIEEKHAEFSQHILESEPTEYSEEYEVFLNAFKTAQFFQEWIEEKDEEFLLEKFNIRPGEIHSKLEIGDWLLYSASELCRLLSFKKMINQTVKVRYRLKYGAKEELMPLLKLRNVGRVRARRMYKNNIKDLGDVKKADINKLASLIGKKVAIDVKKQVGQDVSKIKVKEHKRKGQISLKDY